MLHMLSSTPRFILKVVYNFTVMQRWCFFIFMLSDVLGFSFMVPAFCDLLNNIIFIQGLERCTPPVFFLKIWEGLFYIVLFLHV